MSFQDNNVVAGLGQTNQFQVGVSDTDDDSNIEQSVHIPWPSNPGASYIYYDCTVGVMLDSGIVVHNRLPQVNNAPDTLSAIDLDAENLQTYAGTGVNLKCADQYLDIVQRMGHSRYWFRLWGQALRVAYKVPIPSIKYIGGVPAIPYDENPQWAFNRIFPQGNYGGVILWHAAWSLWYTTALPPTSQTIPVSDPGAHIDDGVTLPTTGIQAPYSQADGDAQTSEIPFFVGGKRP